MTPHTDALPIVVVGSANQDYIVRVPTPPAPGETIIAQSLIKQPGGKGANQAVAAARLRSQVSFVACVGDDADGELLLRQLRSEGVDTTNVEILGRVRTGLALVSVFENGENSITVVPGSNFSLTADRVRNAVSRLTQARSGTLVVIQAELLPEIILAAIESASEAGARVVLNLAPYQPLPTEFLSRCDPLIVNEAEASALVGWDVHDVATARLAVERLKTVAASVIVTIGAGGAIWGDDTTIHHEPAPIAAHVVDTTGAGDAFVGAVASWLARGGSLAEAVQAGVRAGTFAVGSPGAQSSYPTLADLGADDPDEGVSERKVGTLTL